jgi:hypothetical protein
MSTSPATIPDFDSYNFLDLQLSCQKTCATSHHFSSHLPSFDFPALLRVIYPASAGNLKSRRPEATIRVPNALPTVSHPAIGLQDT